jgi:DNA-binding CsgD family transcriptional regulator
MRRVKLEFNYSDVWKQIFGQNSTEVEVLEALRCFRCDVHGLAIVCRIRLKDKSMTVKDLVGKGLLTNIEILYKEKDGSLVVFVEGKSCVPRPPKNVPLPKLLMAHPPEFLDINRMKAEVIGNKKEISKFLQYAGKWSTMYKILGLTSLETKSESLLSRLTSKQKNALLSAHALGYYDIPRRVSSEDVSRHLNVDKSTVVEHLRKAERKLIADIISG